MSYFKAEDFVDGQVEWILEASRIGPPPKEPRTHYGSVNHHINTIQRIVCGEFSIKMRDLVGQRRAREYARPRMIGYWLCMNATGASLATVGRAFNRDHSTIVKGMQSLEELRKRHQGLRLHTRALLAQVSR